MILKPVGLMSSPVGPSLSIDLVLLVSYGDFDHSSDEADVLDWMIYSGGSPVQKNDAGAYIPATGRTASGAFVNYADQSWSPNFTWTDGTPTASGTSGSALRYDTNGGWIKWNGIDIDGVIGTLDMIGFITRYGARLTMDLKDSGGSVISTETKDVLSIEAGRIYKFVAHFSGAATMDITLTWSSDYGGYTGGSGKLYFQHMILRDAS